MRRLRHQTGFTLLELLIAMMVFSVMSVMAYSGLRTIMDSLQQTRQSSQQLAELQMIFLHLQQDISQAVLRPVRDEFGDSERSFSSGEDSDIPLTLTRGGNGARQIGRSDLRRVSYRLREGRLERLVWPVLDRGLDNQPNVQYLADSIELFELRFLPYTTDADWLTRWPTGDNTESDVAMPHAIEVKIKLSAQAAEISRYFVLGL